MSGLGLIGLLTCQLLVAHGCRVLGLDPDPVKCALAEKLVFRRLSSPRGPTLLVGALSTPVALALMVCWLQLLLLLVSR